MTNPSQNKLKPNTNPKSIFGILNAAKINTSVVFVWRMMGESKIMAELRFRLFRKARNEMELRALDTPNSEKLKLIVGGEEVVNVYLPGESVLFQTKLKAFDAKGSITIAMPDMIAQVDRRQHLRLLLNESAEISVSFSKGIVAHRALVQTFTKQCHDISSGGCSFIVSRLEQKYFTKGDAIHHMRFKIDKQYFLIEATIVNLIPVEPDKNNELIYGGLRVCMKFEEMANDVRDFIEKYVFQRIDLGVMSE